ncbi:MAG: hypothetical protein JOZ07_11755 [Solirubrobacterales bacterium]|nr:hypothetical protein [Solirubrobacterales bacterium]
MWVDVRGRGDSDGTFIPYRDDGLDGVDVIAWRPRRCGATGGSRPTAAATPGRSSG